MYKELLGYKIFSDNKEELLKEIENKKRVNIISGNPEVLYNGIKNEFLRNSFTKEDALIIPDGVGTLLAAKINGIDITEKIAGIEVMNMLLDEPISVDVDKQSDENRSIGDRLADKITEVAGSWTFIISMILFLVLWVVLNVYILEEADPYPFILLNLLLSCIAALQAPIIMMSQNREAKKDRLRSSNDYKTDLKSELILEELHNEMKKILANQNKILKYINEEKEK